MITEIKRKFRSEKGSVIVDASICIAIFLIAVISILGLILMAGTEARDFHALAEESQGISSVYASETIENSDYLFLSSEIHSLSFRPFSGIKDDEGDRLVFIFPKRGIRYHVAGCRTLNSGEIESILTAEIRRTYSPCKICKPDTLPDGATVYLYSESSRIYHKQNCATITKTYEKISAEEADSRGYTPCKICLPDLNRNWEVSEN